MSKRVKSIALIFLSVLVLAMPLTLVACDRKEGTDKNDISEFYGTYEAEDNSFNFVCILQLSDPTMLFNSFDEMYKIITIENDEFTYLERGEEKKKEYDAFC